MASYVLNEDDVAWEFIDGECVIIHHETSAYYDLNESGAFLWSLLAREPRDEEALVGELCARYRMDPSEVTPLVRSFLETLTTERLVTPSDVRPHGKDAGCHGPAPGEVPAPAAFAPPLLTRHGELERLLLSAE